MPFPRETTPQGAPASASAQAFTTGQTPASLTRLAATIGAHHVRPPAADPVITGVTLDSRRVAPGFLYAALPGATTHGARFAAQVSEAGALAIVTDPVGRELIDAAGVTMPLLIVDDPRGKLGAVAAAVYGDPSAKLLIFGVTGTNGKTTTSYLLHSVLSELGRKAGLIGTVETRIGAERVKSVRTTPEAPELQALFAQMVDQGADSCAIEVSSHALALHRVDAVRVDVAGFTNLSQDHLDFHDTFEDYFASKAKLFTPEHADHGVICIDDQWGRRLAKQARIPVTTLLTRDPSDSAGAVDPLFETSVDWRVTTMQPDPNGVGMRVTLTHRDGEIWRLTSPLPGDFNVANSCLAALMLVAAGLQRDEITHALANAPGVPGRMQVVPAAPDQPLAVVDYAHSPDSISAALTALRRSGSGPIAIVFGAGGDRDRSKRPHMGEAAVDGAEIVVVTDDNPRSEDPASIRNAVMAGARERSHHLSSTGPPGPRELVEVPGRQQAIAKALALLACQPGIDGSRPTVLVAGKGHETGQEIAGTVYPFDDRDVLAELLGTPTADDLPTVDDSKTAEQNPPGAPR